jgi:hypothetical protein
MTPNAPPDQRHAAAEERRIREAALDQTIENSFPASDPPSTNPNPYDCDALPEASAPAGDDEGQPTGAERASRARSGGARRGPS